MIAVLRKLVKWFYICFAVAAISLAVVVQAGRSFSHLVKDYPEQISRYFSNQFNANVSVGSLSAEWDGLKPMLDVRQLRISSQSNQPILALEHAALRLDLLDTLLHARLVWSSLTIAQARVDFSQSADGLWHIAGLPPREEQNPAQLDSLIDMLLLSRHIEVDKSHFSFQFASGDKTLLESPWVRIENADGFHRLSLQVDVDKRPKSISLVIEAKGDPRKKGFSSDAFLQLNQFPTSEPIAAASALLLQGIKAEVRSEGTVNANLWFKSRPQQEGFEVVGNLGVQRLSLPVIGRTLVLDSLTTEVAGTGLASGKWQFALQNINTSINDHLIEHVNLAASAASADAPLVLHMQTINLAHLNQALDSAGLLGEQRLRDIMRQLNPQGELRNIEVAIPTRKPEDWQLRANLHQVSSSAWQGVPALTQLDGFVAAGQRGGYVDINSQQGFSMHFSPTYSGPMEFAQAKGQVAWWLQPENNQVYVNSGALEFDNGAEKAKGYMWLALPWKRGSGDLDLYLQIGARQLGASQYSKFVPAVVPQSLLKWLSSSIGEHNSGYASEGGFVYRGTLNSRDRADHSHQLYLDINRAELKYHPEWPALQDLSGRLLVDDEKVEASVDSATLFSSQVAQTQIRVAPNPNGKGALLQVNGSVTGAAADGLRVLRESMLRQYIGANMDSWSLDGELHTQVNIAVPLEKGAPGAAQQIDIDLHAPAFTMGNLKLNLRDVAGHISFNQDAGLSSRDLKGWLFDEPVQALLSTKKHGGGSQTLVDVKGELSSQALARWSRRPEALFLQGKIPYVAHVELNHRARAATAEAAADTSTTVAAATVAGQTSAEPFAVITVTSPLTGVAVKLPAPYGKTESVERPLIYRMALHDNSSLVDISYGDILQAVFELEPRNNNQLRNANIALGEQAALSKEPQFLLSGNLPSLDIEPWKKVQRSYSDYAAQLNADTQANQFAPEENRALVAGLPFRASVVLGRYQVGPLALENIHVNARRLRDAWTVQFSNPLVVGDIYLPNDTIKPLQINLQQLHLPRDILEGKKPGGTADSDRESLAKNNKEQKLKAKQRGEEKGGEEKGGEEKQKGEPQSDQLPRKELATGQHAEPANQPDNPVAHGSSGANIDPRSLPFANVTVRQLYLDEKSYGSWSLQIRPNFQGVLFDNIHGSVRDITISGADDPLAGAKLSWKIDEQGARTHFIGSLSATNLSTVMQAWQKPDTIESSAAQFRADVSWEGAPQDFGLKKLSGNMDIWIEKGRFIRTPSVGSDGFLRLVSILNFDSLARRLRLDFSDLYKSGLAYDQISGKVNFEPGMMTFAEPLVVQTPSSRLQMAGKLDLNREKINTRLVATLPVAGNLTFAAALAAGLPAAAGIYLVSKLFKKQVDQATSVSYRITGGWDDPNMSFDRLFESEDSLRDSVIAKPLPAQTPPTFSP